MKCDKIDVDHEELLSKYHYYGERSLVDLDNPEMTTFIAPRIDAAVDVVYEAILIMENLNQEEAREKLNNSNRDSAQKKELEIISAKLEAGGNETLLLKTLDELDKIVTSDEQTEVNVALVEVRIDGVQRIEVEVVD